MDSVNPTILFTAGTAAVGLLVALSVCLNNSAPSKEAPTPSKAASKTVKASTPPAAASDNKLKKKEKAQKKKSTSSSGSAALKEQLESLDDDLSDAPTVKKVPEKITVKKVDDTPSLNSSRSVPKPSVKTVKSELVAAAPNSYVAKAAPAAVVAPVAAPAPVPAAVEAPAKAKKQKKAKAASAAASAASSDSAGAKVATSEPVKAEAVADVAPRKKGDSFDAAEYLKAAAQNDGWNVVEDKKKLKPKAVVEKVVSAQADESGSSAPVVVVDATTVVVQIDAKKVGIIIGARGATLKMIQELTGAVLNTPKDKDSTELRVNVTVTGPAAGVAAAARIIDDLAVKGYSLDLEGEDFAEGFASIHPSQISDLIGVKGAVRKAIQDHTGVKINIPQNVPRDQIANVRVGVAGPKGKVTEAKKIIKELIKFKHTALTHPGYCHEEVEIPPALFNVIIGARGSEIRQIQGNFKVSVHIPNENSVIQNVLVVGEAKGVQGAVKYIHKIIEQATRDRTAAVDTAEVWADAGSEDVQEEWMEEFVHPSKRKTPAVGKADALEAPPGVPAPSAAASSVGAWGSGVITASEGW